MAVRTNLSACLRPLAARAAVAVLAISVVAAAFLGARPAAAAADPCPCGLFAASAVPGTPNDPDGQAQQQGIEVGMHFTSDVAGFVGGIRFYKGSGNTGVHFGDLWDASGNRVSNASGQALAFGGETASGWQTLTFRVPVPIAANTTYVASYHSDFGSYSSDTGFFDQPVDAPPLHSADGGGVYAYGGVQFPNQTFDRSNYWVDVLFDTHVTPQVTSAAPGPNQFGIPFLPGFQPDSSGNLQATFDEPVDGSSVHMEVRRSRDGSLAPGTVSYGPQMPGPSAVFTPSSPLAPGEAYTVTVSGATDAGGFTMSPQTWSFTTAQECPCTIFPPSLAPPVPSSGDPSSVELGMTFESTVAGQVEGIRFYKSSDNTGTHMGELWTADGQLLASVTFPSETASGWQNAVLASPVVIAANTPYVVSYHTDAGNYSQTDEGFQVLRAVTWLGPFGAPSQLAAESGSFAYGPAGTFPNQTFHGSNYWVDVRFRPQGQVG